MPKEEKVFKFNEEFIYEVTLFGNFKSGKTLVYENCTDVESRQDNFICFTDSFGRAHGSNLKHHVIRMEKNGREEGQS